MGEKMRVRWKPLGLGLLALLVLAQFIPMQRTNPSFDPVGTLWATGSVAPGFQTIFQRSCQDCHSNLTKWPWYSRIAPVSWLVAGDVNEGRRHMNIDEWASYSSEKRQSKFTKICEELKSGDMPDTKYLIIHRNAKLSDEERAAMCNWAEAARQALLHAEVGTHP